MIIYIRKKILWKRGEIAPLFHNIFNISLTSRVQLHIYLSNVVVRIIFSSILQIWYVEVRISRSISESPLEFEITGVDCSNNENVRIIRGKIGIWHSVEAPVRTENICFCDSFNVYSFYLSKKKNECYNINWLIREPIFSYFFLI